MVKITVAHQTHMHKFIHLLYTCILLMVQLITEILSKVQLS